MLLFCAVLREGGSVFKILLTNHSNSTENLLEQAGYFTMPIVECCCPYAVRKTTRPGVTARKYPRSSASCTDMTTGSSPCLKNMICQADVAASWACKSKFVFYSFIKDTEVVWFWPKKSVRLVCTFTIGRADANSTSVRVWVWGHGKSVCTDTWNTISMGCEDADTFCVQSLSKVIPPCSSFHR